MYAQLMYFDGPRSAELIAANDRGGRERIMPTLSAHPEVSATHRGTYVLRQPDGSQIVLVLADDEQSFDTADKVLSETPLLPGEDIALLPGPDRFARYEVIAAYGADFTEVV